MVLKTLDVLGPQHGYGIARRIEQISGELLAVNHGTWLSIHDSSDRNDFGDCSRVRHPALATRTRRACQRKICAASGERFRTGESRPDQRREITGGT
jgi:hypothetical protein